MMKKLLVLSLVLAVSAVSTAAWTLDYAGGQFVIGNTEPVIGGMNNYLGTIGADISVLGNHAEAALRTEGRPAGGIEVEIYGGADAIGAGLPYDGGVWFITWGDPVTTPNPAGFWMAIDAPGLELGSADNYEFAVGLMDGLTGEVAGTLYMVPEPMTMGLLGLGALFLRRRK